MIEPFASLARLLSDVILPNLKAVQKSQAGQIAANQRLERPSKICASTWIRNSLAVRPIDGLPGGVGSHAGALKAAQVRPASAHRSASGRSTRPSVESVQGQQARQARHAVIFCICERC